MQKGLAQLTLELSLKDEATFENFVVAQNGSVVQALQTALTQRDGSAIYICGARDQGRSHLLQAVCHRAHQLAVSSVYCCLKDLSLFSPNDVQYFASRALVCIDDIHMIAGNTEWEEAIFHLYNRVLEAKGRLVFSANALPKSIALQLPDLSSRLASSMIFQLHTLSDNEKLLALTMRAYRRGIDLSDEVGRYILTHYPRHMGALFVLLEILDKESLSAKRRLTIPFVKKILESKDLTAYVRKSG